MSSEREALVVGRERSRCAALVRAAGCVCQKLKGLAPFDPRAPHDPRCPEALAARIEAGGEAP